MKLRCASEEERNCIPRNREVRFARGKLQRVARETPGFRGIIYEQAVGFGKARASS